MTSLFGIGIECFRNSKIMYHNPAWVAVGDPSLVAYYDMNTVVDNKILDKSIYQGNISYEDKIFTVNHRGK